MACRKKKHERSSGEKVDVYCAARTIADLLFLPLEKPQGGGKMPEGIEKFSPAWQKFFKCCLDPNPYTRADDKQAVTLLDAACKTEFPGSLVPSGTVKGIQSEEEKQPEEKKQP